jgi:hypothetical protein
MKGMLFTGAQLDPVPESMKVQGLIEPHIVANISRVILKCINLSWNWRVV